MADLPPVDLAQEANRLVEATKLGVVVLDVARGEIPDALHLHAVDHRGKDLLAGAVLVADRDPDHLSALVLAGLVAEPDGGCLSSSLELIDEGGREEVERKQAAGHEGASLTLFETSLLIRKTPRCRSRARSDT